METMRDSHSTGNDKRQFESLNMIQTHKNGSLNTFNHTNKTLKTGSMVELEETLNDIDGNGNVAIDLFQESDRDRCCPTYVLLCLEYHK